MHVRDCCENHNLKRYICISLHFSLQMPNSHSPTRPRGFVCWKNSTAALTSAGRRVIGFSLSHPKSAWGRRAKLWGVKWTSTTVMTRLTSRSGNAGTTRCSPSKAKSSTLESKLMNQLLSPKRLGQITTSQSLGQPAVLAQEHTEVQYEDVCCGYYTILFRHRNEEHALN